MGATSSGPNPTTVRVLTLPHLGMLMFRSRASLTMYDMGVESREVKRSLLHWTTLHQPHDAMTSMDHQEGDCHNRLSYWTSNALE